MFALAVWVGCVCIDSLSRLCLHWQFELVLFVLTVSVGFVCIDSLSWWCLH